MTNLSAAIQQIEQRIQNAKPGHFAETVKLVAVSKTFGPEIIREAYRLGLRDFGENRAQELLEKKAELPADIRWHMIGRLQTNKVKDILGKVVLIHSLDRPELFEKIESELRRQKGLQQDCLLQVNVSGEAAKAGFAPEKIKDFLARISPDTPVKITGLMTMAPLEESTEGMRTIFRKTKALFEDLKQSFPQLNLKYLSMGMSGDFEVAVQEGANLVRIGTALFGNRN